MLKTTLTGAVVSLSLAIPVKDGVIQEADIIAKAKERLADAGVLTQEDTVDDSADQPADDQ